MACAKNIRKAIILPNLVYTVCTVLQYMGFATYDCTVCTVVMLVTLVL